MRSRGVHSINVFKMLCFRSQFLPHALQRFFRPTLPPMYLSSQGIPDTHLEGTTNNCGVGGFCFSSMESTSPVSILSHSSRFYHTRYLRDAVHLFPEQEQKRLYSTWGLTCVCMYVYACTFMSPIDHLVTDYHLFTSDLCTDDPIKP